MKPNVLVNSEERTHRRGWRLVAPLILVGIAVAGCSDSDDHPTPTAAPTTVETGTTVLESNLPDITIESRATTTGVITAPHTTETTIHCKPRIESILLAGSQHQETQQFGANTFADIEHVCNFGPRLAIGAIVTVDCVAHVPPDAATSAEGVWYHIIGPPEGLGFYAAANTFENGDITGSASEQAAVDPNVPDCPGETAPTTSTSLPATTIVITAPPTTTSNTAPMSTLVRNSYHSLTQKIGEPTYSSLNPVVAGGPYLPEGETVLVDCVATASAADFPESLGPDGETAQLYHMTSPPFAGYYTPANSFHSGVPGSAIDTSVPDCP